MTEKVTYTQQGDYLIPDLRLLKQPNAEIGVWGQRRLSYIRQHRKLLYADLLTSCKLVGYLADIDARAEKMFSRLVEQMAQHEGVTEQLKANNQFEWVRKMNNIQSRAREIVLNEMVYA